MFKVSFKENAKKVQVFNNKATVVTLTGRMDFPTKIWNLTPQHILRWMWDHPSVDVSWGEPMKVEVSGKSICSDIDAFNLVLGERIAESRAKIKLYKFLHTLTSKICDYHFREIYGGGEITNLFLDNNNPGLYQIVKKYQTLMIKESHHLGELLKQV